LLDGWWGTHEQRTGFNTYRHGIAWESGAKLAWTPGRDECCLSLSGSALGRVPLQTDLQIFTALDALGPMNCTRIDSAIDLPWESGFLKRMNEAREAGQYSGFRTGRYVIEQKRSGEVVGETVYLGTRNSEKMFRAYDKRLESDGQRDCIRLESQLSGGYSKAWWNLLRQESGCEEHFVRALARAAITTVNFVDRTCAHNHADRMKPLDWWQRIVEYIGKLQAVIVRVKPQLQTTMEWFMRTMPVLLAKAGLTWERETGEDGRSAVWQLIEAMYDRGISRGAEPSSQGVDFCSLIHGAMSTG
jgi:hypothetical protein